MRNILIFLTLLSLFSCGQNETSTNSSTSITPTESETNNGTIPVNPGRPDVVVTDSSVVAVDTPATVPASPLEQKVLDIRNEYTRINGLGLAAQKFRFVCDTDGSISYFTENGKVVKIAIDWGFLGDGQSKNEYYYKNGALIFAFEQHVGGPAGLPETTNEFRSYVQNDRTIKYLRNQKEERCRTCSFSASSREYKALKALETRNFKSALCNL